MEKVLKLSDRMKEALIPQTKMTDAEYQRMIPFATSQTSGPAMRDAVLDDLSLLWCCNVLNGPSSLLPLHPHHDHCEAFSA